MLIPSTTTQFRKDLKKQIKRGCDMKKLEDVLDKLVAEKPLGEKHRNHKLTENYIDRWESHIEPDWLLIYRTTKTNLFLERTGSHADLF
jgi:mRNA interferase YafQ